MERVLKATEPGSEYTFEVGVIFEYVHRARMNTVPRTAMAFCSRGPQSNVLTTGDSIYLVDNPYSRAHAQDLEVFALFE